VGVGVGVGVGGGGGYQAFFVEVDALVPVPGKSGVVPGHVGPQRLVPSITGIRCELNLPLMLHLEQAKLACDSREWGMRLGLREVIQVCPPSLAEKGRSGVLAELLRDCINANTREVMEKVLCAGRGEYDLWGHRHDFDAGEGWKTGSPGEQTSARPPPKPASSGHDQFLQAT